jgi:hypothetical protein
MNHPRTDQYIHSITARTLFGLLVALASILSTSHANAAMVLGNPYTPTGADFSIFALQGIDSSNPFGATSANPQVNIGVEFRDGIGVSYDKGGSQLQNFGVGLYSTQSQVTQSTGLRVQYNAPVDVSSVTITLEDFDIDGKATSFRVDKVEPSILLLGAGNSILATASPLQIFSALRPHHASQPNADVWDLNLGALANGLHTPITGFVLAADMLNGERSNSDPYFLVSTGNAMPAVPEPANYLAGLAALGLAAAFHGKQLLKRRLANQF